MAPAAEEDGRNQAEVDGHGIVISPMGYFSRPTPQGRDDASRRGPPVASVRRLTQRARCLRWTLPLAIGEQVLRAAAAYSAPSVSAGLSAPLRAHRTTGRHWLRQRLHQLRTSAAWAWSVGLLAVQHAVG